MSAKRVEPPRRCALRFSVRCAAAMALLPLAGCSLNNAPRREYQVLRDVPGTAETPNSGPRVERVLLLASPLASPLYDSSRMVYSVDGSTRSYFEYGHWSERPASALNQLALARLAKSGIFSSVALSTAGVRGDLMLTLRLDDLYFDETDARNPVRLAVTATLVDWRNRRLLATERFELQQPSATRDADGMAQAAGVAVGRLLDQLVPWCAHAAMQGAAAA